MNPITWIRTQWQRSDWPLYVATLLVTGALTVSALELWAAKLTVPLTYWGDALAVAAHFKTVSETGWYEYQSLLGAPYGQTYNDFPTADNLNFIAARILTFLTGNYVVALNLYFVLGFLLAAVSAVWLFRRLGISRVFSLVLAALFALAPYHFTRGESHLWLASYFVIPLSIGLVMMVMRDQPLFTRPLRGSKWYAWFTSPFVVTLVILALTGTSQSYYSVFFLIFLAFAGIVRLIRTSDWRRFWGAAAAGGITVVVMLINMAPDLIYSLINGQNPSGLDRGHADSEIYALKLTQLLMPWSSHRIDALRALRAQYDSAYPLVSEYPALGFTAAVGLVAVFLVLAYRATTSIRAGHRAETATAERVALLAQIGALVFVAFLFSTVGGISTIISFVTTSLRGWNRMSIYIAILCLAAVGILLDLAVRWLQSKVRGPIVVKRVLAIGVAGVLLAGGYIDQTPENPEAAYPSVAADFDADQTYFTQVADIVPASGMVLQLPYQAFPETSGPTGVLSSDALIPYLHTTDVRWSAGGIKGRPRADYPSVIERYQPAEIAELAAAANFSGILIDREAMVGDNGAMLTSGLVQASGANPLLSADDRYAYIDLTDTRAGLEQDFTADELSAIAARITNPIVLNTSKFATVVDPSTNATTLSSSAPSTVITLTNGTDKPQAATLTLGLLVPDPAEASAAVELTMPDGSVKRIILDRGAGEFTLDVTLAPGLSTYTITVLGSSASHPIELRLPRTGVTESVITEFLAKAVPTVRAPDSFGPDVAEQPAVPDFSGELPEPLPGGDPE